MANAQNNFSRHIVSYKKEENEEKMFISLDNVMERGRDKPQYLDLGTKAI